MNPGIGSVIDAIRGEGGRPSLLGCGNKACFKMEQQVPFLGPMGVEGCYVIDHAGTNAESIALGIYMDVSN